MFRVANLGMLASTVFFGFVVVASTASAQTEASKFDPIAADVACVSSTEAMPVSDLEAFFSNPQKLLSDNPGGGLSLSNQVRTLSLSSSKAYAAIMDIAKNATGSQRSAIGAGLARAFAGCGDTQPEYAQAIASDVADLKGSELFAGFSGANTGTNVAAVNAAGASSSAVGGGDTDPSSSQRSASNNRPQATNASTNNVAAAFNAGGDTGLVDDDRRNVSRR